MVNIITRTSHYPSFTMIGTGYILSGRPRRGPGGTFCGPRLRFVLASGEPALLRHKLALRAYELSLPVGSHGCSPPS
jgi:hypothetical protein